MGLSPAATLLRHLDTNEFELTTAKTLPRRSMHLQERNEPARGITCRDNGDQIVVPLHNAPRPMTLPTRGAAGRAKKLDGTTGARVVNGGSTNESTEQTESSPICNGDGNGGSSPCESPSYLTNTFYKFPESANTNAPATAATTPTDDTTNPIPLPPREGKKHIKTNAKRHVRKYPLIIPVNGLQRTLNMVTETTPTEDGIKTVTALTLSNGVMQRVLTTPHAAQPKVTSNMAATTVSPVASSVETSTTKHVSQRYSSDGHTYQNLDKLSDAESGLGASTADSASLHFESILEADYDKGNVLQSPDVTDGFYNFSIQKEHYNKDKTVDFDTNKICGLYVNEDELRNLDIERNLKLQQNSGAAKATTTMVATVAAANTKPQAATVTNPVSTVAVLTTTTNTTTEINAAPSVVTTATITLASTAAEAANTAKVETAYAPESAVIREKSSKNNLTADNELAGNALFKKVRESVDLAMDKKLPCTTTAASSGGSSGSNKVHKVTRASSIATTTTRPQTETEYFAAATARLKDSNSVSCEDLLEFSDKKPKGCERGVDSDEVRIMVKVLGKNVSSTKFGSQFFFI